MEIIKCSCCKKEKDESNFSIRNGKRNKQCIECRTYYNTLWQKDTNKYQEKRKAYYKNNKEKHQVRNFKNSILKKYGVTVERYNEMLKAQSNRCAICEIEFVLTGSKEQLNKLPCIDHSHQTNKVRGLLCRKCNIALGHIESGFTEKAYNYLRLNEV